MLKILLVSPNFNANAGRPLLGLAYIASALKNYDVRILDLDLYEENILKLQQELSIFNPNVVGITCYTMTLNESLKIAKTVKLYNKNIMVVMGGVHATVRPQDCFKNVDIVVRGEGEITFPELLTKQKEDVLGISYLMNDSIIHNPSRPPISNLDSLKFPARHLLELEKYSHPIISIMSSRGCPFHCIFCTRAIVGEKWTPHSSEYVIEEIKDALKTSKHRHILFVDDLFTFDKERVKEICRLLVKENLGITWACSSRVNTVDFELLSIMKNAGCTRIGFGVESGDDNILLDYKKGITTKQVQQTFKNCKKLGIETVAFFMIGALNDTNESISKTINFALEIDPHMISWSIVTPLPGTKLWNEMNMDSKINCSEFSHFNESNHASFDMKYLKKEEIQEWYNYAIHKWKIHTILRNLINPKYFINKIKHPILTIKQLYHEIVNFKYY